MAMTRTPIVDRAPLALVRRGSAALLLACGSTLAWSDQPPAAGRTPPSSATGSSGKAPAGTVDASLGEAYAALVDRLPTGDNRGSTAWKGLSLDAKGLVADKHRTDATVPQMTKQLAELQPIVTECLELTRRDALLPPNPDEKDTTATAAQFNASKRALEGIRGAAHLLTSDAARLFAAGKQQDAAIRLAACLGLVKQLTASAEMNALAGQSILGMVEQQAAVMRQGAAGRKLDAEAKAILRTAFERLDPELPFGFALPGAVGTRAKLNYGSLKAILAP